jgi:hypothetical protein
MVKKIQHKHMFMVPRQFSTVISLSLSLQRHYSPGWASASCKSFLHPSRFRATTFQFLHPSFTPLPSLHLPSVTWAPLWVAFLLAQWGGFSWINHRHPGVWHVLPISICSVCRFSECYSHHTGEFLVSSNLPSSSINHWAIDSPEDFALKNTKTMFILLS